MRKAFLIICGGVLIAAGVLVPITTAVVTFILPETYASTAKILPGVTEAAALAAEVENIKSDLVLSQVITNLNLNRVWADRFREETNLATELTRVILKNHVDVSPVPKVNLIEIKVYSQDRIEAANTANEIAKVYQNSDLAIKSPDGKSAVQIMDNAKPSLRPARPNKPLNIGIGCGVGVILVVMGIALLLFSRLSSRPPPMKTPVAYAP